MNAKDYQEAAMRTECDQRAAMRRVLAPAAMPPPQDVIAVRLLHAGLGMSGEVGEFSQLIERWLWYGQPLDREGLAKELGDVLWYASLACTALGISFSDVMAQNLEKLRKRFPDKFDPELAKERRDEGDQDTGQFDCPRCGNDGSVSVNGPVGGKAVRVPCPDCGGTVGTDDGMGERVQNGHGWAEPPYDEVERLAIARELGKAE